MTHSRDILRNSLKYEIKLTLLCISFSVLKVLSLTFSKYSIDERDEYKNR